MCVLSDVSAGSGLVFYVISTFLRLAAAPCLYCVPSFVMSLCWGLWFGCLCHAGLQEGPSVTRRVCLVTLGEKYRGNVWRTSTDLNVSPALKQSFSKIATIPCEYSNAPLFTEVAFLEHRHIVKNLLYFGKNNA